MITSSGARPAADAGRARAILALAPGRSLLRELQPQRGAPPRTLAIATQSAAPRPWSGKLWERDSGWPGPRGSPAGGKETRMIAAGPAALCVFICASLGFNLMAERRRRARLRQGAERAQMELLTHTLSSLPEGVIVTDAAA